MCQFCSVGTHSRRGVIRLLAATAGYVLTRPALAAEPAAPPKPQNVVSPERALHLLMAGNDRYVAGVARRHDFTHEREALTAGQNPYAAILSCADSRVAPEYAFDAGRGDLFVCRVAGNFANDDVVASLEYAVSVLNTPLIMVLGHDACGAVGAALKSLADNTTLRGHLPSLVAGLAPAVKASEGMPGDKLRNAIRQNVVLTVEKLKAAGPTIAPLVDQKRVRIVGGVYGLADGHVAIVA